MAVAPMVENMPGGNAQRPGDVVRAMNGKTIEVINTDAEGRLVLADAIAYVAKNYKPARLIDIATLTGACVVALGFDYSGLVAPDDDFARQWGELGPVYGKQWRGWGTADGREIDQIAQALEMIRQEPYSRRILVNGWNVGEMQGLIKAKHHAPPSCHTVFQFYVSGGRLDLQLYQRSADMALGVPYNIASYAALLTIMAQETGLRPGIFTHTFGDAHIYLNHLAGVKEQLTRQPYALPTLKIVSKPMSELTPDDFVLENYQCHPFIKFQIAV